MMRLVLGITVNGVDIGNAVEYQKTYGATMVNTVEGFDENKDMMLFFANTEELRLTIAALQGLLLGAERVEADGV